ncbi:MAG: ferrochelatase, partial [Alphaproteobacteria bacterium]
ITPIAFVSVHVETLVEMDHEYALLAESIGVRSYVRVPALSIDTDFINALTQAATKALEKTGICPAGSGCGKSWKGCPCRKDVAV